MCPCTVGSKSLDPFVEKGHIGLYDFHLPLHNTGSKLPNILAYSGVSALPINRKFQRLAFV